MKIKIISYSFLLLATATMLMSYQTGPAAHGWDCTGAESDFNNPTGCSTGSGCHASSANAGITVSFQLIDSTGTAVTQYVGGKNYKVRLSGVNTTASSLPKYGFQITSITGSSELTTPVSAGTWSNLPAQTHLSTPTANDYVLNIVEHSTPLAPASGSGATGTTYVDSFTWTAPVAGTGTISIWAALNAVNNNGQADAGDLWNVTHMAYTEDTAHSTSGIATLATQASLNVYPNPVIDILNLQWENVAASGYSISVHDLNGRCIVSENRGAADTHGISTSGWAPGIYLVTIQNADVDRTFRVVRQ